MSFNIPNLAAAAHSDQAAPDQVDFAIIGGSFAGTGVVSGCAVTASAGLTVSIASGVIMVAGAVVSVTGTTKTSAAADPVSPRFDLVVVDNAGTITIQGGTAGTTPAFPAVPANSVALASLFIGALQVTTSAAEIIDKRVFILNTFSAGVSTGGNTSNVSGLVTNRLVFAGGSNITLSGSTSSGSMSITFVGATLPTVATTVYGVVSGNVVGTVTQRFSPEDHQHSGVQTLSAWRAGDYAGMWQAVAPITKLPIYFPAHRNQYFSGSAADLFISLSLSTSSNSSWAGAISATVAVYTLNGSTLSQASSGSAQYLFTNTSNNSVSSLSGIKRITVPINVNMTPGHYWFAAAFDTATTNANWFTFSNLAWSQSGQFSGDFLSASNATNQVEPGFAIHNSAGFAASVAISALSAHVSIAPTAIILRNIMKA